MKDQRPPLKLETKQFARKLRKRQTGPESKLWQAIRNGRLAGIKFRRQHPIEAYIVDFYCDEQRLIVELDGNSHAERATYDRKRQNELEAMRYRVFRVDNDEVLRDLDSVLAGILIACRRDPFTGEPKTDSAQE